MIAHTARILAALAIVTPVLTSIATTDAQAGRDRRGYSHETPVKDCTKFNGWRGYYGNLWCSAEEQRAFDVWEARRHAERRWPR